MSPPSGFHQPNNHPFSLNHWVNVSHLWHCVKLNGLSTLQPFSALWTTTNDCIIKTHEGVLEFATGTHHSSKTP